MSKYGKMGSKMCYTLCVNQKQSFLLEMGGHVLTRTENNTQIVQNAVNLQGILTQFVSFFTI